MGTVLGLKFVCPSEITAEVVYYEIQFQLPTLAIIHCLASNDTLNINSMGVDNYEW